MPAQIIFWSANFYELADCAIEAVHERTFLPLIVWLILTLAMLVIARVVEHKAPSVSSTKVEVVLEAISLLTTFFN